MSKTYILLHGPRLYCTLETAHVLWTNLVLDSLIAISYVTIFTSLIFVFFRLKNTPQLSGLRWILASFGLFIVTCAGTHLTDVINLWWPMINLSTGIRMLCAATSVPTAIFFSAAAPSLSRSVQDFVKTLALTQMQRDMAEGALSASEAIATERKQASLALAALNSQLTSVLEYTSDSVMTIAFDWTLLYGNRRTIESTPDFFVGRSFWDCFPAVIGTPLEKTLREAMETGTAASYENFYEPYQQWFKGRIFPTDSGLSIFYSDCTKEKQIQEQLELEQVLREKRIEALSHMAGGLAHEISNPLAIIDARAKDLRSLVTSGQTTSRETIGAACDSIINTADRAARILRGLRGFGREAGKDPMEWASVYDIAEGCIGLQQDRFHRHHITLDLELASDMPLILCRETQISQILTNLLNNAFDAIEQSHTTERWVRLTAIHAESNIVIQAEDSGPGIEDKFRPHLMDAFFTTKTAGLGMGVGLSLSRAIAQDHGGSLTLKGDTIHTCFELVLPITPEQSTKEMHAT